MTEASALGPKDPATRVWADPALTGAWLLDAHYQAHRFEKHLHDEMVVVVTEGGSGEVRTRFGTDRSSPDTVWVFAAGEYHGGRVVAHQFWNYRAMYLHDAALRSLAAVFTDRADKVLFVPPGLYHDRELARELALAHRLHQANAPLMRRETKWWAAMGLLFGRYGQPRLNGLEPARERAKMARVREYVTENFRRDISVDELARLVGLSRYYLMRSFRNEFGLPPHSYVNQLRLIEAKRQLRQGVAAALVAVNVGFYDQSHLTRVFKRAYDLTPGAFAAVWAGRSRRASVPLIDENPRIPG